MVAGERGGDVASARPAAASASAGAAAEEEKAHGRAWVVDAADEDDPLSASRRRGGRRAPPRVRARSIWCRNKLVFNRLELLAFGERRRMLELSCDRLGVLWWWW
jgi:hypothetical protein